MTHPDQDAIDNARFGPTSTPCDKCPIVIHLKEILTKAKKLALLVNIAVTDPIPAGMQTEFDNECRKLSSELLE